MTPTEALALCAAIGKRLEGKEREAFRLAYAALSTRTEPLEAQIEALQALREGSRVSVTLLEDDPELGPWCAWIEWRDAFPHEMAELGKTPQEALTKLREALEKKPEVKT